MANTTQQGSSLPQNKIRQGVAELEAKLKEAQQRVLENQAECRRLLTQIEAFQGECAHPSTKKDWVQDCAEMKLRNFCLDCGAQC